MNGKNVFLISMLLVSSTAFAAQTPAPTTPTQNPPAASTQNKPTPAASQTGGSSNTLTPAAADVKSNFLTVAYAFAKDNKLAASFLVATGAVTALAVTAFFANPVSEQNDDEDTN
mgnify:CR=1 FL=1